MVNWWLGLVVWIPRILLWKGLLVRSIPRIPNHQLTIMHRMYGICADIYCTINLSHSWMGKYASPIRRIWKPENDPKSKMAFCGSKFFISKLMFGICWNTVVFDPHVVLPNWYVPSFGIYYTINHQSIIILYRYYMLHEVYNMKNKEAKIKKDVT